MGVFLIILYSIILAGSAYGIVYYCINNLKKNKYRLIVIALPVIACVVFIPLIILTSAIPSRANRAIEYGITITETKLNEVSPDYTNKVLDKEKAKTILQDGKQMRQNLNEYNSNVSFLTRVIGFDIYLELIESFVNDIDIRLRDFESRNEPFTIHNILKYIQEETNVGVKDTARTIAMVLFIIACFIMTASILLAIAMKLKWIDPAKKSIVFGDNI